MPVISTETHVRNDNEFANPDEVRYEVDENGVLIQISRGAAGGQHLKFIYDVPGLQTANLHLHREQIPPIAPHAQVFAGNGTQTAGPSSQNGPITPAMPSNFNAGGVPAAPRRPPPIQRGSSVAVNIAPMNLDAPGSTGSMWTNYTPRQDSPSEWPTFNESTPAPTGRAATPAESVGTLEYVSVRSESAGAEQPQRVVQRASSLVPTELISDDGDQEYNEAPANFFDNPPEVTEGNHWDSTRRWVMDQAGNRQQDCPSDHRVPNVLAAAFRAGELASLSTLTELDSVSYCRSQAGGTPGPEEWNSGGQMFVQGSSRDGVLTPFREASYKENIDPMNVPMDAFPETPKSVKQEFLEPTVMTRSMARAKKVRY